MTTLPVSSTREASTPGRRPRPFEFPTFASVEDERRHRQERLAATFRLFGRFGFDEGVAGHVTARDPEHPDRFWVNPWGLNFKQIRVSDLVLVDHRGTVLSGEWPINPAAFAIHSAVHAARPDVIAAAHTHSVHGRALSALSVPLLPISQDACAFFDDHVVDDEYGGVANDVDEGRRIAASLGSRKAAILRHHGLLTVGGSVEAAAWWFISMERNCQAQLLAMAAGEPSTIDPQTAAGVAAYVGSEAAGVFSFHPLWGWIVAEEPDLLD